MKGMKFVKETKKNSEPRGIQRKCSPMKKTTTKASIVAPVAQSNIKNEVRPH